MSPSREAGGGGASPVNLSLGAVWFRKTSRVIYGDHLVVSRFGEGTSCRSRKASGKMEWCKGRPIIGANILVRFYIIVAIPLKIH